MIGKSKGRKQQAIKRGSMEKESGGGLKVKLSQ